MWDVEALTFLSLSCRSWTWAPAALQVQDINLKLKLSYWSERPQWCACRTGSRRFLPNSWPRARVYGAGAMRRVRLTTHSRLLFTFLFSIDRSQVDGRQRIRQHKWKHVTNWQRSWTKILRSEHLEHPSGQHNAETWCRATVLLGLFDSIGNVWFPAASRKSSWWEPSETISS